MKKDYVDLGLSVKWATCNVGANNPEEYGNHYAWGEIIPKNIYNWETYKWCNGTDKSLIKYSINSTFGTVDNKTVLEPEDDAATVNWGGKWRMPTNEEWTELQENCTRRWTDDYNGTGVAGRIVTSKINGNSIFLPAAGYRNNDDLYDAGSYGIYWSSSLFTNYSDDAWGMYFDSDDAGKSSFYRYCGLSIRPVTK